MVIQRKIIPYPGERWALDNGAFSFFKKGHEFDMDLYIKRVHMATRIDGEPYFAVAPDIVMGGDDSLHFSNAWMDRQESEIFENWYLAVQDRMSEYKVRKTLSEYNYTGLFLGGSNEFKLRTAWKWKGVCNDYDLKFHYARCGRPKKIRHAISIGADSIDTAIPLWSAGMYNDFLKWIEAAECTPPLMST